MHYFFFFNFLGNLRLNQRSEPGILCTSDDKSLSSVKEVGSKYATVVWIFEAPEQRGIGDRKFAFTSFHVKWQREKALS